MIHDRLWPLEPDGGVLCIECLEVRIGRRLVAADFTDCSLNRYAGSARLRARYWARTA